MIETALTILWVVLPDGPQAPAAKTRDVLWRVARGHPDVLVLDATESNQADLELGSHVRERFPEVRVVLLGKGQGEGTESIAPNPDMLAVLPREAEVGELAAAVLGDLSRAGSRTLAVARSAGSRRRSRGRSATDLSIRLTDREREILPLAAAGNTSSAIGRRFFISRRTVERHRANIMRKLEIANQTELVCYALRRGILELGETGLVTPGANP